MPTLLNKPHIDFTRSSNSSSPSIASIMSRPVIIYDFQSLTEVIGKLSQATASCAVVVDGLDKCVGLLTKTDIHRYQQQWRRFLDGDPQVLTEIYDTNKYGCRRMNRETFHRVRKHMSAPVVTIAASASCADARLLLESHNEIHHLVVVDRQGHPVGVVDSDQLIDSDVRSQKV